MYNSPRYSRPTALSLVLLFAVLLAFRLYGITNSPFERGDYWRQPDTESVAINFVRYDHNPLRPNFNYDGPLPNVVALELQVTTAIIALLYSLFGRLYWLARLVPIGFFLGSCWYLYLWGRRHLGHWAALWATAFYGVVPVNLYYSRAIMPESAALFFTAGALWYFQCFTETGREQNRWLLLSGLFLLLAGTQKPQTLLVALPMLGLLWVRYRGPGFLADIRLWAFAASVLGLTYVYYWYSNSVAEFRFVHGITTKHVLAYFSTAIFHPLARQFFRQYGLESFGWIALVVMVVALLVFQRRLWLTYLWLVGTAVNLAVVVAVVRLPYYLMYIVAPLALVVGAFLDRFRGRLATVPLLLLVAIAVQSWWIVHTKYLELPETLGTARAVQMVVPEDDLILTPVISPVVINACDRRGWRFNISYYPDVPEDPIEELHYYIHRGAKWFVTWAGVIQNDPDGRIRRYLDEHYERLEPVPGYPIYRLRGD